MIVPSKSGYDLFGNFGEIIMAKCNVTGTRIALTIATESLIPDGKVYIWDLEKDRLCHYDFLNKDKTSKEDADSSGAKDTTFDSSPFVRRYDLNVRYKLICA